MNAADSKMLDELIDDDLHKLARKFGVDFGTARNVFDCILLTRSLTNHIETLLRKKRHDEGADFDPKDRTVQLLNEVNAIVMTREVFMKVKGGLMDRLVSAITSMDGRDEEEGSEGEDMGEDPFRE